MLIRTGLLADEFYLMAHDEVSGKPLLPDRVAGLGLAAALIRLEKLDPRAAMRATGLERDHPAWFEVRQQPEARRHLDGQLGCESRVREVGVVELAPRFYGQSGGEAYGIIHPAAMPTDSTGGIRCPMKRGSGRRR